MAAFCCSCLRVGPAQHPGEWWNAGLCPVVEGPRASLGGCVLTTSRSVPCHHPFSGPFSTLAVLPGCGFPQSPTFHAILRVDWGLVEGSRDHPIPTSGLCEKLKPTVQDSLYVSPVLSPRTSQWPNSSLGDSEVESHLHSLPPFAPKPQRTVSSSPRQPCLLT